MILTNSSAAKVGNNNASAIASSTALFRQFVVYAATTISSVISGPMGLIKNGAGALTLSGNNTYTGATTINAGTLALGANQSLGAIEGAGALNLSTYTLTTTASTNNTLSGAVAGSGNLIKAGTGTLTLSGNNTYTGTTTISAGTLKLGSATGVSSASTLNATGGVFDLNGYNATVAAVGVGNAAGTIANSTSGSGTNTLTVLNYNVNLASLITDGATAKTAVTINNNGAANVISNANNTFSGGLTLAYGVSGGGTRLYQGSITNTIVGGILTKSNIGTGTLTIGVNGATANAQLMLNSGSIYNNIIVNAPQYVDGGSAAFRIDGTGIQFYGTMTAGSSNINISSQITGSATLNGQLTGTNGLLLKTPAGASSTFTLTLANTANPLNNYSGNTTISLRTTIALAAVTQIPSGTGKGNVINDGTLTLGGLSHTINGLSGSGTIDGVSGTPTLTVGNNDATSSFSGVIKNTAGTLSVTKIGTGSLTLSGVNTYSGATTLNAGTLIVTGNIANSDLVIASGILSVNTTAAVKMVNVKSLTVNGAATFACTVLSATAVTPGTNYDQINSAGALTLNNTSETPLTIAMYGTPTGWSNTGIYDFDIINAPSVVGFAANKLVTDFTNFGVLAASRTGNWIFSNPSLGIVRMRYAGVAISNFTWDTGTGNWGVATNWVENAVVSQNAYISFTGTAGGTSTNTVAQATLTTLFDITFSAAAGAYTLNSATGSSGSTGGTAMALRGDVINNSSNTQTIAFNYSILHNQIHSGNTTISGIISSTGGLIKGGAGTTLLLLGANTFTGGINVANGTLSLGSTGLLGNGTYAGAISNASALIFGSNSNQTLSGVISGAGTLTKDGSGILALSGVNTHSGTIALNAGTLAVNSTGALGTCALVIAGGSLNNTSGSAKIHTGIGLQYWNADFTFIGSASLTLGTLGTGGDITLSSNRIVTVTANEFSIGSRITGGVSLTKNGAGTLTLAGSNLYSGGTIVSAGLLNINGATALGSAAAAPLTLSGGNIGCTHTIDLTLTYNHPQNWNADFSYTGGARTLNLGTGTVTMNANRQVNIVSGGLTIGGNISNTYSLTKTGTGTLTLNGINTLSGGGLIVNAGTVVGGAQFGITSPITINSGGTYRAGNHNNLNSSSTVTINSGGTLTTTSAWLLRGFVGELVMNGGTLNLNSPGDFGAGAYTFSGTCSFNPSNITQGTTIFNVTSGTTTMTGGVITYELLGFRNPAYGLIKNGAGTLDLGTIVNRYGGPTVVNEGAIVVRRTTAGVTATATLTPTTLTVDFGGATPQLGTVFKFFPGATQAGITVTLTNMGTGVVGTYNHSASALSIGTTPETTGLQLWYDATVASTLYSANTGGTVLNVDGASVMRWEDISGNGAHLFGHATISSLWAKLKIGAVNGKNAVRCDGSDLVYGVTNVITNVPNSVFVYVVARHNSFTQGTASFSSLRILDLSSSAGNFLRLGSTATNMNAQLGSNNSFVSRPMDLNTFLIGAGWANQTTGQWFINGVQQSVGVSLGADTYVNRALNLGNQSFNGDYCEVLVYGTLPTQAERQAIETYLRNKWAIY